MIPAWLEVFAYIWLGLSAISFLIVVIDVPRQNVSMPIMKLAWPLTTLYTDPIGLYAYFKLGRNAPMMHHDHPAMGHAQMHYDSHPSTYHGEHGVIAQFPHA